MTTGVSSRRKLLQAVLEAMTEPRLVSASEPTPDEIREYRLDASDPEMRRLNWQEWRAHIGEEDVPFDEPEMAPSNGGSDV